jgi:hypothetical protein
MLISFILFLPIDSQLLQHTKLAIFKILPHTDTPLLGESSVHSMRLETFKTSLYHFLLVFSLQVFAIISFLLYCFYIYLSKKSKLLKIIAVSFVIFYIITLASVTMNFFPRMESFYNAINVYFSLHSLLYDFQLLIIIIPMILGFIILTLTKKFDLDDNYAFILALFGVLVVLIVELANIEGRYVSMNKVYGEVYIFWGIASVYILYLLKDKFKLFSKPLGTKILFSLWIILFTFLFLSYLIFPILSSYQKASFKPPWLQDYPTLDGSDYLKFQHNSDYEAIKWINQNIRGTPRILEVPGRSYQYTSRISIFTGLPTVLGMDFHMSLMLSVDWPHIVAQSKDADTIYNTTNNEEALKLIKKYNINYIYIGELEKNYTGIHTGQGLEQKEYTKDGLEKFNQHPENYQKIYDNNNVQIYKVYTTNV